MKVLIFSPQLSLGGGVAEFCAALSKRLSAGIESELFLIGRRAGKLGKAFRVVVPIYDAIRLAWILLVCRHDVYHLNPSLVPRAIFRDGIFLVLLRLFGRQNVIVFFRGWDTEYFRRIAESPFRRFLFRTIYGHTRRVLVLASEFSNSLESLGFDPQRIHLTTTMFEGDLLNLASRSRQDDWSSILFLARFEKEKGIYELLEVFRRLSLHNPKLLLTMAGDGLEAGRARDWCLRHSLSERVHFPGYVMGIEKAQLLADSDIFVLPSYREGCPNSLLEAMGAGLPVVVTPVGGIPHIVQDGINGLVVQIRDTTSLEQALSRLIDSHQLRADMGRENRAQAWSRYEASKVTAIVESHYSSVIAGEDSTLPTQ